MKKTKMKYISLLLLFTLPLSSPTAEEFKLKAVVTEHYMLTRNGFIKDSQQNDTWSFVFSNNSYALVTTNTNVALSILQSDDNTISLSQPVLFSGSRVFTFFRKTKKFSYQETAYSNFSKLRQSRGELPESINISYGRYSIE